LKTRRGPVFAPEAGWRGATKENIPGGSSTEEQQSQAAFGAKTLRAAGLLTVTGVGSFLTARCGDARNSPPWPRSKSPAAGPLILFKQALKSRIRGASLFQVAIETIYFFADIPPARRRLALTKKALERIPKPFYE
jgi:hypothetical protein